MKLKILFSTSILAALLLFSSYTLYYDSEDKHEVLMRLMIQGMNLYHYQPQEVNDAFSVEVYDNFLKQLDYNKRYLLQSDVHQLQQYRERLDDELNEGAFAFFEQASEVMDRRINEAETYVEDILVTPFDLQADETLDTDVENMAYANSPSELKDRWRQLLKYQVLSRVADALKRQEEAQAEGDESVEIKSLALLEQEARERVRKNQERYFERLAEMDQEDRWNDFVNAVANTYDPHSGYFPPQDKSRFDEDLSGQFEGIGAQLQETEGYIKVVRILPGSASARQGRLKANDRILKVGQAEEDPIDVVGMDLTEVVKLIRGPKGTEVQLTVRKADGSTKVIPIVRDVVEIEETFAKSVMLKNAGSDKQIGYIYLPKFYVNFQDRDARRCATDVAIEIEKLTAEGADGLILDLRGNVGGSLPDVVEMTGLFIEEGPVVQVRSRRGRPRVRADKDPRLQYGGPLIVMVNSLSASASEILAAAIQDYGRGVIIGSPSFGKGTVQSFVDLDDFIRGSQEIKPLGQMKLTIQKFYRINGGATQLRGVMPDIILPDEYSQLEIGEKEQPNSLEWDEIEAVPYQAWDRADYDVGALRANSQARISQNQTFSLIEENAARFKTRQEKDHYPLQLEAYQAERAKIEAESQRFEDLYHPIEDLKVIPLQGDAAFVAADSVRIERRETWYKDLKKDPYLYESMQVMQEMW
jgi:carboxyl-terminal processing protease